MENKKRCSDCKYFVKIKTKRDSNPNFCNKKRNWLPTLAPCKLFWDKEEYDREQLREFQNMGYELVCDEEKEEEKKQNITWDQV